MKILIISNPISIHTSRWINQLISTKWDISLFPSLDLGRTHPNITKIKVYHSIYNKKENINKNEYHGINILFGSHFLRKIINNNFSFFRQIYLAYIINKEKPDIIHIIEFQHSGYLYLKAIKFIKIKSKIILTNWGSDIYYFQKFKKDREKIEKLLRLADYYTCECQRDVGLAKKYGFTGQVVIVSPNGGGYELEKLEDYKKPLNQRKLIMLKGYGGLFGRFYIGLKALEKCIDIIKENEYKIALYSHQNNSEVLRVIRKFKEKHNIKIIIIPHNTSHLNILKLHGKARISLGFSISDGISTSLLESIVMGSFPIQTDSSCASEWIECGKNGYIVSLKNKKNIVKKIRTAIADDNLVKKAARINSKIARKELDYQRLKQKTIKLYESIYDAKHV